MPTAAIKARGCTTQVSAYKGKVSPWQSRVLLLRLRRPNAFGKLLYAGKDWTDYKAWPPCDVSDGGAKFCRAPCASERLDDQMARIPYAQPDTPERQAIAERIIAERGSLTHLYKMLLNSAPVAEGWLTYLTAIRQKCKLNGAIREMVIMRVAFINGASYEADQHAPIALREGLTQAQVDALHDWESATCFTDVQRAVLAYCDTMTKKIQVPDDIYNGVAKFFDSEQMIELTATIAAYNMVSRFLEALQVHSQDNH